MMKKVWMIVLVCSLIAATLAGCTTQQQAETPVETAAPEATATPVAEVTIPETEVPLVRLESIDYKKNGDDVPGTYLINVTNIKFNPDPAGEIDTDYILEEGDSEQLAMSKDAVVDFPLLENLPQTVTVTVEELTSEFQAFVQETEDKPLFTVEKSGDEVMRLTYFYLP